MKKIRSKLLISGVKNLKQFGYPYVNNENILTDIVYSGFFKSMLYDSMGVYEDIDIAIKEIISEIDTNRIKS